MTPIDRKDLVSLDFENIKNDSFWDFDDQIENKMHRIHTYPAKFPAFITRKAIQNIEEEQKKPIKVVGDIFCGCGTTAYEARLSGKDFWGLDINPVAVLISKVKSNSYVDKKLSEYFNAVKYEYAQVCDDIQITTASINPRIYYWFEQSQIKELLALKKAIIKVTPTTSKYKNFFLVAFSNILKPASKWLQKSIKPTIDPNKPIKNVWKTFEKQFCMMQKAHSQNNHHKNKVVIKKADVLNTNAKSKIDLLVSSPPYVTSYEYADLHQMSALWLDYTDDYKNLRRGTIGSIFHNIDFEILKNKILPTGQKIINRLFDTDKKRARDTAKYFWDIEKSMRKSYQLLNPNGQAMFVIGNTEYKNIYIDNAKHLVESMFKAGFQDIKITKRKISNKILTPYRTKEGKFTTKKAASKKIYAEEFLVIGKK